MYFKNGRVKVALALAKGKQAHDKRDANQEARSGQRDARSGGKIRRTRDEDVSVTGSRGQRRPARLSMRYEGRRRGRSCSAQRA
jgi:hypothetical protein